MTDVTKLLMKSTLCVSLKEFKKKEKIYIPKSENYTYTHRSKGLRNLNEKFLRDRLNREKETPRWPDATIKIGNFLYTFAIENGVRVHTHYTQQLNKL